MQGDRFDLAVVGAGLNGSLLALAAGEAGLDTVLVDRVPLKSLTEAGFDGRTTAIAYVDTNLDPSTCAATMNCDARAIFTISKTF